MELYNNMTNKQELSKTCLAERERLLNKYVGNLLIDFALSLSQIGEIIEKLEDKYKQFLSNLWEQVRNGDSRSLDDILDKRYNRYVLNMEYAKDIRVSQAAAEEITLWEQITSSNYRDIEHLNALVGAYAWDLLAHNTQDFMEDVK